MIQIIPVNVHLIYGRTHLFYLKTESGIYYKHFEVAMS